VRRRRLALLKAALLAVGNGGVLASESKGRRSAGQCRRPSVCGVHRDSRLDL